MVYSFASTQVLFASRKNETLNKKLKKKEKKERKDPHNKPKSKAR